MDVDNLTVRAVRECALRIAEKFEPTEVVGLGDLLECAPFSRHAPSSAASVKAMGYVEQEIEPAQRFLDRLQDASRRMTLIMGNHEHRAERWAIEHGLGGADAKLLRPSHLLRQRLDGTKRKAIEIVEYAGAALPHAKIAPNLIATHGWSFAANALQKCLDLARSASVVTGHIHRAQESVTRNPLTGETYYGWSPGCLCSRTPDYRAHSPTNCAWGVTLIYRSKSDPRDWTHYHVRIEERGNAVRAIMPDGAAIAVKVG